MSETNGPIRLQPGLSAMTDPRPGLCGDIYDPARPDDHLPCRLPAGHADDNPDDWHSDGLGGMWAP